MSKASAIVLAFVVVVSLGVSGYLLFNKNESERIAQIRKKAEAGDAAAQFQLGQLYIRGNIRAGLERDDEQAAQWLRKAAEQAHQPAQYVLGVFCQSAGDDVGAYVWLSIVASRTNDLAAQLRDATADQMTEAQLAEARQMIGELQGEIK